MIDTIKLLVPISDPSIIRRIEGSLERFRKEDLKTGKVHFEFHSANIKLGSYERNVSIKSTIVPSGLFVECSFPKYAKGNNVEMVYPHELPSIAESIYTELCAYINYLLIPVSLWQVYRLDICYNWTLATADDALHAIDFIKRVDYPRKKKHLWDTSVMHQGSAYVVKFYGKGAEFKKRGFKEIAEKDWERAHRLQEWANRVVRFEVGMKHRYLVGYFKRKKLYLSDISDDAIIQDILKHFLHKVFFYVTPTTTTMDEVRTILYSQFSAPKAFRLYQFYKGYYYDDEMKEMYLRGGMNRSTIYRYRKTLQKLGIGFVLPETTSSGGILEQLVIPSPSVRFTLNNSPDTMPV
jgi:II/X family phage/plasmid replication protein